MFKFSQAEETYFTCHHLLLIPPQVKPNLPLRHVSHSISHALMCGESISHTCIPSDLPPYLSQTPSTPLTTVCVRASHALVTASMSLHGRAASCWASGQSGGSMDMPTSVRCSASTLSSLWCGENMQG